MATTTMKEMRENGLFEDAKEKYENTSKSWKKRWWDVVCDIWHTFTKWQEKYDLDMVAMTIIKKVKRAVSRVRNYGAEVIEKIPITFAKGTKICYLFKFYNAEGELLFSKIGTTERTIRQRLKEEIDYYKKHGIDVALAAIESAFDTGDMEPEGAQDYAKGHYIRKFKGHYIRNDRFACDIDVNDFNALISNFLTEVA